MIESQTIKLFQNLSQYDYDNKYYDFHNDYDCIQLLLNDENCLDLKFRHVINKEVVHLKFYDVQVCVFVFFNYPKVENLTVDNLYRGRTEKLGELIEFLNPNNGYFYLEFDEGQKLEFWSSGLRVMPVMHQS